MRDEARGDCGHSVAYGKRNYFETGVKVQRNVETDGKTIRGKGKKTGDGQLSLDEVDWVDSDEGKCCYLCCCCWHSSELMKIWKRSSLLLARSHFASKCL